MRAEEEANDDDDVELRLVVDSVKMASLELVWIMFLMQLIVYKICWESLTWQYRSKCECSGWMLT